MSLPPAGFNLVAICEKFEASPKVMDIASQCAKPSEFIAQLRAENMGQEAVQAMSRMMPKEKAVEWAEQSARIAGEQAELSPDEVKALDAARAWSADPTEEARLTAAAAAGQLPASSPAMWIANAAAFSKPPAMPTGTPALPVADDLTAQMVAGAVQLSAVKMSASGLPELLLQPGLKKMIEVPMPSTTRDVQQAAAVKVEELTAEQRAQAAKQLDLFLERGVALAELSPGWS